MTELMTEPATAQAAETAQDLADRICRRIPPLWDLGSFVAVNPFLGFAGVPVAAAARQIADGIGGQVLPPAAYYRRRWAEGAFGEAELAAAAARAGRAGDVVALRNVLDGAPAPRRLSEARPTAAERLDSAGGSAWSAAAARHIAAWCAAFVAEGAGGSLYRFWRERAAADRTLAIEGLPGWRAWVLALPEDHGDALERLLPLAGPDAASREAYLYRLLAPVYGWAALLRREAWASGGGAGQAAELLAVCLAVDSALARLLPAVGSPAAPLGSAEDESARLIFQEALEDAYARRALGQIGAPPAQAAARPEAQAVFCIDVRSERLRRHLEAQSPGVETLGFAGFFGVALDLREGEAGSARCPVLLRPAVEARAATPGLAGALRGLLKQLQSAPASAFTLVETAGLAYALGLAADALGLSGGQRRPEETAPLALGGEGGLPLAQRADIAQGILRGTGLGARAARLVLLCGHAATTENNAHAAGLDCGACGGHGGAPNARAAAAILNDPEVRAELRRRGAAIPDDTWFQPALHDTMTDEVTLLDAHLTPAAHRADADRLAGWLDAAGRASRAERAPALGLAGRSDAALGRLLRRRSRDWSEARPEWGLARNAAFIAARRSRTRGLDLQGRAFLHEYDWSLDPDGSGLAAILSAPAVVASWISLQYFASTVDNQTFGSGTKALHNRVGGHGVLLGGGGDLRTGLSLQSVCNPDGSWHHEPLRLQVVVEAPLDTAEAALRASPAAAELVESGWVRLLALDPASAQLHRRTPQGWEAVGA